MVAVVGCVSSVGGSPIIAALRIPPGRGAGCAATDGALSMTRNTIIRAVRAIESPPMKIADIRAYPLKTRTALVRVFKEPLELTNGHITLRDRPGLGLEIDEKALAKAVIS